LWDAVGGFLFLFANMQDKLSKHSSQVELLKELLNLQKDMVIMMLSMLEGNVVNGTIGKQMVDTLVESASNVELILKYFDMFLKLKDLTGSPAFQESDATKDGWITPKEFREKMEAFKSYSPEEIDFLLACCDTNHDGKIDYIEFTERFHNPAKEIGFNLAVLLTNLSEHMPSDPRLARFLETAGSVLNYFESFLGRIEIMGGSKCIERVYFEINESNIEQWEKPQIKESKRAFFYSSVTEGGDKEKLEVFVNFCEDAIFEMQHASALMASEEEGATSQARQAAYVLPLDDEDQGAMELLRQNLKMVKDGIVYGISQLSPANVRKRIREMKQKTYGELIGGFFRFLFSIVYYAGFSVAFVVKHFFRMILSLMRGPQPEKVEEKPEEEKTMMLRLPPPPSVDAAAENPSPGTVAITDGAATATAGEANAEGSPSSDDPDAAAAAGDNPPLAIMSKEGLLASSLSGMDPYEEAAKAAAAAAEVQAQQEAAMADLDAKAATPEHIDKPPVSSVNVGDYAAKAVSFLARNFYNLKYLALILAFCINFLLLFYKATSVMEEEEGGDAAGADVIIDVDDDDGSGSGSGLAETIMDAVEDIVNATQEAIASALENEDGEDADGGEEEDDEETIHVDERFFYIEHIVRFMAIIHSLISLFMLVAYYHLKVPLAIFKREKEIARRLEFDGLYIAEQPEDDDIKAYWDKLVISAKSFPVNYWDKFVKKKVRQKYSESYDFDAISNLLGMEKSSLAQEEEAPSGFINSIIRIDWRYQVWKAGVTITDNAFLYSLWYFTFSILGNFNYFFFCAHLLDIAVLLRSLRTILQSVTHNGKQLVLTFMLLTIIVYIYTVIAFNFFRKFYVQEEDDNVDRKCHDMLTCFVFHIYKGVRAGGGIGDEIESPDGDDYEVYRILFDITFFFFIIVILLAIIQGLIIDAFGELRDQLESVKEDMESNCFICGIGKDFFDTVPHGFDTHVQKEHNLANYLFFFMHLINKPDTEYTGQETYVWNMYQQRCWDFFPVGDCFRKQYENELSGGES